MKHTETRLGYVTYDSGKDHCSSLEAKSLPQHQFDWINPTLISNPHVLTTSAHKHPKPHRSPPSHSTLTQNHLTTTISHDARVEDCRILSEAPCCNGRRSGDEGMYKLLESVGPYLVHVVGPYVVYVKGFSSYLHWQSTQCTHVNLATHFVSFISSIIHTTVPRFPISQLSP